MHFPTLFAITVALGAAAANPKAAQYEISYADSYLLVVTGKAGSSLLPATSMRSQRRNGRLGWHSTRRDSLGRRQSS